jgi:hypothetical protein
MGEMAELFGGYDIPDDYDQLTVDECMDWSDDDLRKHSARSRSPKIMSIRRWQAPLTEKQRYCLAFWVVAHQ